MELLKEQPYIQKLIAVVKNSMQRSPRKILVNGRLSDAFVCILSGACTYRFEDGIEFTVQSGDVLYLANQAVYEMELQTEAYSFIYVDFLFENTQTYKSKVFSTPDNNENNEYWGLFKKLYSEYKSANPKSKVSCMRRLYNIYEVLCERNEQIYIPRTLKEKMEKSKEYMHAHYTDKELSIAHLAELAKMSEVYFRKIFQQTYKIAPKKYLTKIRLEHAQHWMQYSFLTLKECASLCGFSSWQYFTKVFKNETGETPAVYRKKKLEKI